MGLTRIEYGSIASSSVLNDNFEYLGNKFDMIGQNISTLDARVSSVSSSLNNSINNLSTATSQNLSNAVNTLNSSITSLQNRIYIVETLPKSQLPRWYRVWSDGWCEQGGYLENSQSQYAGVTVNLVKNFKDTQYHILTTGNIHNKNDAGADQKQSAAIAGNATIVDNTSFKIATAQGIPGYYWYAYGYIN